MFFFFSNNWQYFGSTWRQKLIWELQISLEKWPIAAGKKKNTIALEVHSWIGKKKWHLFHKSHYLSQVLSLGGAWLIISECLELSVFLVLSVLHMFTVTPTFSFILAWISELFRSRSGFWMQKPSNDQILITSTKQIWTISSEQWKPLHR